MKLKQQIKNYIPYNEQEQKDKQLMLQFLEAFEDVLTRDNLVGHFTASAWVINKERTKVLMVKHNLYHSWAWAGGHADGQEDLQQVAIRELKEETGIEHILKVYSGIFSLECMGVTAHKKRGEFVSCHLHLNVTYLFEVEETQKMTIKPDENSGVKWIPVEDIKNEVTQKWVYDLIYAKEIEKVKQLKNS